MVFVLHIHTSDEDVGHSFHSQRIFFSQEVLSVRLRLHRIFDKESLPPLPVQFPKGTRDSGAAVSFLHSHFTHFPLLVVNPDGHVDCSVVQVGFCPAFLHSLSSISFHSESIHLATFLTEAAVSSSHSQFKSF